MAEIKLYKFMESLYDIVGDKIIEFCERTYYGSIVFSFEQSYDGKEWTKEVEFASFENCTDLYYENDWNEGQTYLQNLRIWHLEDSEPTKHGHWKWNKLYGTECSECGTAMFEVVGRKFSASKPNYCPNCGAKMDEVED